MGVTVGPDYAGPKLVGLPPQLLGKQWGVREEEVWGIHEMGLEVCDRTCLAEYLVGTSVPNSEPPDDDRHLHIYLSITQMSHTLPASGTPFFLLCIAHLVFP